MRFTSATQVSESRSVAARSLLLGFSMAYSTRNHAPVGNHSFSFNCPSQPVSVSAWTRFTTTTASTCFTATRAHTVWSSSVRIKANVNIMNDKPILGPDGNPVHAPKEGAPLPLAIQTFIEGRVSREVAGAREALRHDAGEARRVNNIKGWIKYGALVLANVLFALFIWVFDSTTVKELIPKYVAEHMNRPTLEAAARDVITNKTAVFVSQSLRPLAQDVASNRSSITNAEQAMQRLRDEQRLIAMVSRAEALDAEALRELRSFAQGTNEMAALAHEMIRKVERTLSLDKGAAVWAAPSLQHGELRFTGPFTSDELASGLLEAGFEEGYVNVIGQERRMLFVPKLVELAHSSKDLWLDRKSTRLNSSHLGI